MRRLDVFGFALVAALFTTACRPKPKPKKAVATAAPIVPARSPATVCAWGTSAGLPPSLPWGDRTGEFTCLSKELAITRDSNLRYYAKGDRNDVKLAYLVLTVFNPADGKRAQEETADAFRSILRAAYGDELAPSEHERIRTSSTGSTLMGGGRRVTLVKTPHVNGRGYEYRVELEVRWY